MFYLNIDNVVCIIVDGLSVVVFIVCVGFIG